MVKPFHIVCPHCHTTNRVRPEQLEHDPACGQCKKLLFVRAPLALNAGQFERHVTLGTIPVLVDFWAPWCGPCLAMAPAFAAAATQLEPQIRVAKVDTEAVPELAAKFNIRSIPTLILFKDGRELGRQTGALGTADICRWVQTRLR